MDVVVKRFEVVLVILDSSVGKEINKTRPAIIISPDEINQNWSTVLIIPLTASIRNLDFRADIKFKGREGQACVDQMRSMDKMRIIKKLGVLDNKYHDKIFEILRELFRS